LGFERVAEDNLLWIKETIVGPLVVAAILGAVGIGIGAWSIADDLSNNLTRESYRADQLASRLSTLERQFEAFRKPGDRFTAKDGQHLHSEIDAIGRRVDVVNQKCQQCREKVGRIETQIEYFHRGN